MRTDYENYFDAETQTKIRNHNLDWAVYDLVKDYKKILDVGAGAGIFASKLKKLGKEVTCIDIKKGYVEYMKKNGLNAIKGDVNKLPFKNDEFDCVVCMEVLEHIENLGLGLKELCRVAKNVVFTLPKEWDDEWHLWKVDYIPYLTSAQCIAMKLTKKDK